MAFLIVIDPSSPIVIPDDPDGESSANHDTRPGKPDHTKNIDPTQAITLHLASQPPTPVDGNLGKSSISERDSSVYKTRTIDGAVDTTRLRETARSDIQPTKPDGYGLEYSTGRKGLARKHSPQKRTASSSPDIPGNAQGERLTQRCRRHF